MKLKNYFGDKWLVAIEDLSNINRLVKEDIRDMILTGNDEKYRIPIQQKEKIKENIPINANPKNIQQSSRVLSTEATESSHHDRKKEKPSSKHVTKIK